MNRTFTWITVFCLIAFAAGTGWYVGSTSLHTPVSNIAEPVSSTAILARDLTNDPSQSYTMLRKVQVDADQDGAEESIELFTSAQRDSKGEMMWDDGQKWLLLLRDENKGYVLFDDRIQLGQMQFGAYVETNGSFHVVTIQDNSVNIEYTDYLFNPQRNSFTVEKSANPQANGCLVPIVQQ
ncbi:MAG: hypothetical protein ACM3PP_06145 [Candidatus Saccharibacteria bacterium]